MRKEAQNIMARLRTLMAIKDAQIRADPIPHLTMAYDELYRARKCFEEIEYALSPDCVFDVAIESNIKPVDIQGEAYFRCTKALDVIREYTRG